MAVVVEHASVILCKSAVEQHVPGGVDAIAQLRLPNLAEDEYLVRVGFMSTAEADRLMAEVEALASPSLAQEPNVALLQWNSLPAPAWLSVGLVDERSACWLAGTPPGPLVDGDGSRVLVCAGITEARVLAALREAGEISRVARVEEGTARLICSRGDALIDVQLWEGDGRVGVVLDRRLSRRRTRLADLALAGEIIEALRAVGAQLLA